MSTSSCMSVAVLLLLVVGLSACVSPQARVGDWERAISTHWTLTKLDGHDPLQTKDASVEPLTLELSGDGRAAGFAGVNRFFGQYESNPLGDLRFGALGSTRMFRDDPVGLMDQEQQYLAALGQVDAFRFQSGQLVLLTAKKKRLVFTPTPEPDPA
ncbi:MAG: META domain-containing protein [Planctomycetota bacterium]